MTALVGLLTTFLILEGTAFGSARVEADPLVWLALPVAAPLLGMGVASVLARRGVPAWRRRRLLRTFHLLAYLIMYAVVVYPAGWGDFVMVRLGWFGRPLVSHALLLVPGGVLALWVALWFHRAVRELPDPSGGEAGGFFTWVGGGARLIVVPTALLAMAIAVTQGIDEIPALGPLLEIYPSLTLLVALALLALAIAAFPRLVLLAWPSRPLPPGDLRESLNGIAARAGVRLRDVRVWERTTALVNACVAGHFSRSQRVFFTGGARDHLTDDGLRAVFAHEVSHITSGHLRCYVALLVAYVLALSPLQQSLDTAPPWVLGLAFLGLTVATWWALFGYLSRRLEVEADVRGAALVPDGVYIAAFDRVRRLLGSAASAGGGWRHFSLDRRYALLREALTHPDVREALLASCRRWKIACLVLLLVAALGFAWSAGLDLSRSPPAVALDRGAYALEHAADLRRILEERDAHPRTASWPAWIVRAPRGIEAEYAEALARARDSLARAGDEEEAGSLRAAIEDHAAWWETRG